MSSSKGDFDRLERAMAVFAAWDDGGRNESADALIEEHADLQELLEPLLEDALGSAPSESATNEPPPTELGGFRIEYELGRGAMGVVYAARQLALDRMVALKVLPTQARLEPRAVARFRRESELLATLKHPSLVEVLTVGREDSCEFFAMELVDGVPLSNVIRNLASDRPEELDTTRFGSTVDKLIADQPAAKRSEHRDSATHSPSNTRWHRTYFHTSARIAWQIADALSHAHQADVLHRDVKSSNILLRRDGRAVLTDFGLAREVGRPSLTQSGEFAGTPYYAAPEQVLGNARDLDGRVDVFALGVVLYEMLTLRRPFEGNNSHEVAQAVVANEPVDPQSINRRIPAELAAITLRALEKDPRRRYRSARELADDLDAFLNHRPVRARKAGPLRRLQRYVRREPWQAALAVVLIATLSTVTYFTGYLEARAPIIAAGEEELRQQRIDELLGRATMNLELGDTSTTALIEQALELDPKHADAIGMLVWTRCDHGGMPLDEFEELIADTTLTEAERQLLRVPVLTRLGRGVDAAAIQERLEAPQTPVAAFYKGLIWLSQGHRDKRPTSFQQSANAFELAVLMSPRRRPLYLNKLAHALGHAGSSDRRAKVAAALARSWPDSATQQYWSYFAEKDSKRQRARQRLQRAIQLRSDMSALHYNLGTSFMKSGLHKQAIAPLERSIEMRGDYAPAHGNLSQSLFQTGKLPQALAAVDRAIELDPDNAMFVANRGQYLAGSGKFDEAIATHQRALAMDPAQQTALGGIAWIKSNREGAVACVDFCRAEIAKGHEYIELYRYLVWGLTYQRRYEEAVAAADAGIAKYPDSDWLHMRRGYALRFSDHDAAIASARRAAELAPSRALIHQMLGKVLWTGKATEEQLIEAAEAFERASQLAPNSGPSYINCATAWQRAGHGEAALAKLRQVTEKLPKYPNGHERLGAHLLDAGKLDEAIAALEAGSEQVPGDKSIGYRLAFAMHRKAREQQTAGDSDQMRRAAERGIEAIDGRTDDDATRLRQQLELLLGNDG